MVIKLTQLYLRVLFTPCAFFGKNQCCYYTKRLKDYVLDRVVALVVLP